MNQGGKMKVNKIDHICIAVKNLEEARKVWEPVLGKQKPDDEYVDEPEKIKVARYWVGGVGFELMESTTPDGDVAKFVEKRGEGIMLISLNVDNTRESMAELKQQGYPFIFWSLLTTSGESLTRVSKIFNCCVSRVACCVLRDP